MDHPTATVLRAWKDESFRNSLTDEQCAEIPPKPRTSSSSATTNSRTPPAESRPDSSPCPSIR